MPADDLTVHVTGQRMDVTVVEADRAEAQPGPAALDLRGNAGVRSLGLVRVLRAERPLLLALADQPEEAGRDALAESVDAGLGMANGTGHGKRHCVPPLCTTKAVQNLLSDNNFRRSLAYFS